MKKNIKDTFNSMIKDLVDTGVLNESQSTSFTPLIDLFESKIQEADKKAIATVKKVSQKMLEEYDQDIRKTLKKTFKLLERHNALTKKLAIMEAKQKTQKKIVESVDKYLGVYVEKLLPESLVVDYDRLNQLETLFESFKKSLGVNDKMITEAKRQIRESEEQQIADKDQKIKDLEEEVEQLMSACQGLKKKMKEPERAEALDAKLKDIPALEAKKVRKYFESEDADVEDIDADFEKVLQMVKAALAEDPTADETDDDFDAQVEAIVGPDEEEKVEESDEEDEDVDESDDEEDEDDKKSISESKMMRQWINRSKRIIL